MGRIKSTARKCIPSSYPYTSRSNRSRVPDIRAVALRVSPKELPLEVHDRLLSVIARSEVSMSGEAGPVKHRDRHTTILKTCASTCSHWLGHVAPSLYRRIVLSQAHEVEELADLIDEYEERSLIRAHAKVLTVVQDASRLNGDGWGHLVPMKLARRLPSLKELRFHTKATAEVWKSDEAIEDPGQTDAVYTTSMLPPPRIQRGLHLLFAGFDSLETLRLDHFHVGSPSTLLRLPDTLPALRVLELDHIYWKVPPRWTPPSPSKMGHKLNKLMMLGCDAAWPLLCFWAAPRQLTREERCGTVVDRAFIGLTEATAKVIGAIAQAYDEMLTDDHMRKAIIQCYTSFERADCVINIAKTSQTKESLEIHMAVSARVADYETAPQTRRRTPITKVLFKASSAVDLHERIDWAHFGSIIEQLPYTDTRIAFELPGMEGDEGQAMECIQ